MAKNNKKYWRKRFEDFNKSLEKEEAKLQKRMEQYYDTEFKRLEKEIQAFYSEYGENNIVEFRKAMLELGEADRQLLFQDYDEFSKKYPQYKHLLPVRENIYKLNRIEGLKHSVQMQQFKIGAIEQEEVEKHLSKLAKSYAKDIQDFYGLGTKFNMEDEQIIKSFVNKAWCDGKSFSDRIWDNKAKLTTYLQSDISQAIARGDNIESISKTMKERFQKVSKNDIKRLVYTEDTFMQAESKAELFQDNGFVTYKFSPANDGNVCPKCEALRDKEFNFEDRQPGVNFPPIHPWCRCTIYTDVDDEGDELTNKELEELEMVTGTENEEQKKKRLYENTAVDFNYINSSSYRRKFDKLDDDEHINRAIYNASKKILEHRDGTKFEDLYYIDAITEKILKRTDYDVESEVKPSKKMFEYVMAHPNRIIALHNHPSGNVPSYSDVMAAYNRKYEYGVIACHNGRLMKYKINDNFSPDNIYIIEIELSKVDYLIKKCDGNVNKLLEKDKNKLYNSFKELSINGLELEVHL